MGVDDDDDVPNDELEMPVEDIQESDLIVVKNEGEDEEHMEAKQRQREKLREIQSLLATPGSALNKDEAAVSRLNYLMCQSEVFAHFLTAGGDSAATDLTAIATKENGSGGRGRKKVGRLREEEEDRLLLKNAQAKIKLVRLQKQPSNLLGEMRPYQLEGLNWMIKLFDNNINGILADEMGLGKTLQTISLLAYLREARKITGPHLVIVPKSVCSNWMREFARWCPEIRAVKLQGNKEERDFTVKQELLPGMFDVAVVSYESLLKESSHLLRFKWRYCIIDEAHRIKNERSALSIMVRRVRSDFRLLITGTPLQNNLHELWALLNFLLPEVFNQSEKFDQWFNTEEEAARNNVIKRLHTVLQPFLLRRVKSDVEKDIPPKTETKLYIGMTELQRQWYSKILLKDVASLNVMTQGQHDKSRLMNMLMQLRKCTNHPYLFDGAEPGPPFSDGPHLWESSGKMVLLDKLLFKLKQQGSRVLIFSQMTRMLDILEDYLLLKIRTGAGYEYCRIDGNTNTEGRDTAMDVFNAPESTKFCFLLSTRAGGLGINLQTADTVILYDSDWNPQVDLQAMDRAHRIGQKKPVRVFRFVTERSVEEKVVERADKKLFLDAAVIQQGRLAANQQLSSAELMKMCRFGADEIINSKGGSLTDEDVDALLARGAQRTQEGLAKISKDMQHNLANFSLADTSVEEFDLLNYEGEGEAAAKPAFISLPQRERKRNYDIDQYFNDVMAGGAERDDDDDGEAAGAGALTAKSIPGTSRVPKFQRVKYQAYHFIEPRIYVIQELEAELFSQMHAQRILINKLKAFVPGFRRTGIPPAVLESLIEGQTPEGLQIIQGHTINDIQRLKDELQPQEGQRGKFDLSPELLAEKHAILQRAFSGWDRAHFKKFVACIEQYGCLPDPHYKESAIEAIMQATGKEYGDVSRYYDTFAARYKELDGTLGVSNIDQKVNRGNQRAVRVGEVAQVIHTKLRQLGGRIMYNAGTKGKIYSEENDNALLMLLAKHGYGNAEDIATDLRRLRLFQFDWVALSRSAEEISRRCDTVIRFAAKEIEKFHARKAVLQQELQDKQALEAAVRQETVDYEQLEDLRVQVEAAETALIAHQVPQDDYADLIYVPHWSEEMLTQLQREWKEEEQACRRAPEGRHQERETATLRATPEPVIAPSSSQTSNQEGNLATFVSLGDGVAPAATSTAGTFVRANRAGRQVLQLPATPELSIESAMRQLKRGSGGSKPKEEKASSGVVGDGFGDFPESILDEQKPKPPRKRAPADPSKKRAPAKKKATEQVHMLASYPPATSNMQAPTEGPEDMSIEMTNNQVSNT